MDNDLVHIENYRKEFSYHVHTPKTLPRDRRTRPVRGLRRAWCISSAARGGSVIPQASGRATRSIPRDWVFGSSAFCPWRVSRNGNATPCMPRCETRPRAGCSKWARPVRRAGRRKRSDEPLGEDALRKQRVRNRRRRLCTPPRLLFDSTPRMPLVPSIADR
jgi:hypothetical protein